jgi:hypothetical protein
MMAMYVLGDMMMVLLASELQQCKGMTEKGNGQGAIDGYDFKARSLRIYFPSAPKCILCVENVLLRVHLCKEMPVFICWMRRNRAVLWDAIGDILPKSY